MNTENKMNKDTMDFLETLLFVADDPDGATPTFKGKTVYDFSPAFVAGVDKFVGAFKEHLRDECFPLTDLERRLEDAERSFGGNVFFSLSGHGCGFFDDSDEEVAEVHDRLKAWAGAYRFEGLEGMLGLDDDGKIDLAFVPEALEQYRAKIFSVPEKKAPTPPEKGEHTPGPWRMEKTPSDHVNVRDSDDNMVCEVYGSLHIQTTDARLIAAAPELLEALESLLSCPDLNLEGLEAETLKAIDNARAAIYKAKGGVA